GSQVQGNVRQFMEQSKPEVVESIMSQRQGNDPSIVVQHRSAVEEGAFEVLLDDERDAVTGEVLPRKLRALIKRGELGQLTQPGRRDGSVLVLSGNIYRSGLSQGAHTPSQESYLIGLPISALMHRSAKKGGTDLLGQQVLHEFPDQIFGVVLET